MANSITADLSEGYRRVAHVLSDEQRALLARARDTTSVRLAERNWLLAEIVMCYRAGPAEVWAPVLLDLVAPALLDALQRSHPRYPVVDEHDVSQQLVVQFLHAAATMRIPENGRGLRRKLVSRTAKAVARRLAREGRHRSWHYSLETTEEKLR